MKVTTDACLFGSLVGDIANKEAIHVLDIGTGTGLLALMFAQKNHNALIDTIEIDPETATQAKENVLNSPWSKRIQVINADATNYLFNKKYDVILSNPPFYENELRSENKRKNLALHNDGLLLSGLLNIINNNLHPNGNFYLLLPYKRNDEIKRLLKEKNMAIHKLIFVRQSVNHDYFRMIVSGSLQNNSLVETALEEISIKDENDKYTEEFITLLKEYYLYL